MNAKTTLKYTLIAILPGLLLAACSSTNQPPVANAAEETPTPTASALPPTATLTPTPTEEPTATPEPLVSVDAGRSADLTISNGSDRNIEVYWIDYDGVEQYTKRLTPGQAYTQPTTVGHVWQIRDEASGEIIETITVRNRETNKVILIPPVKAEAMEPTLVPTATSTPFVTGDDAQCEIVDPGGTYFEKACYVDGIRILAPAKVSDAAVQKAWLIVVNMLAARPDVREQLSNRRTEVQIFAIGDNISDLPSASYITSDDAYAIAEGRGTPLVTVGEGNLLCRQSWEDNYGHEVLVHELAHVIHLAGLLDLEPGFDGVLTSEYRATVVDGDKWKNHYAATDKFEYWADGVMMYFNGYRHTRPGEWINTKAELQEYDPALYSLIEETFRGFEWTPPCP